MKKLIPFLLVLLLISCQSFLIPSTPYWVDKKPGGNSKYVYFIGHGTARDYQLAKNNAYLEALEETSVYVGKEIQEIYYRELLASDKVAQLGMKLNSQYVSSNDGVYDYYVLFRANRKNIESNWSDSYKDLLAKEEEIGNLISLAMDEYKNSNDVQSVRYLLKALEISLVFEPRNSEYQSKPLFEKVMKQINQVELKLKSFDSDTASAVVQLSRRYGILHPPVKNANIAANFTVREMEKGNVVTSLVYMTDNKGQAFFTNINPYMVSEGEIVFSIDMESELEDLALVAPKEYVDSLQSLLAEKQLSFSYKLSINDNKKYGILFYEYDENGIRLESEKAKEAFVSSLKGEGIEFEEVSSTEEELEFIIEDIREKYPHLDYIIFSRLGAIESVKIRDEFVYSIGGEAFVIELDTKKEIAKEEKVRLASWKTDKMEALYLGLEEYGKILALKFLSVFK